MIPRNSPKLDSEREEETIEFMDQSRAELKLNLFSLKHITILIAILYGQLRFNYSVTPNRKTVLLLRLAPRRHSKQHETQVELEL